MTKSLFPTSKSVDYGFNPFPEVPHMEAVLDSLSNNALHKLKGNKKNFIAYLES